MTGELPTEDLEALRSRFDVVDAVRSTPRQKPAIGATLGVSRSTIDRAVRELESAGLLERTDEGYTVTRYGELLVERYESFVEEATQVATGRPLLAELPRDAPIHLEMLTGADVTRAGPPAGHHPISCFEDRLETAGRVRALVRTISQSSTAGIVVDRSDDGLCGEFVLGPGLLDHAPGQLYDRGKVLYETGFDFYQLESVPYGLVLLDDPVDATDAEDARADVGAEDPREEIDAEGPPDAAEAGNGPDEIDTALDDAGTAGADERDAVAYLFVYDETNELLGSIVNDTPGAVAWAETQYRAYRRRAEPVIRPSSDA